MNSKKKRKIFVVISSCILILAVISIIAYCHFRPYVYLKRNMDNLLNKEYEYHIDCKVEGMNLRLLGNSFQGSIDGTKGTDVLYGNIKYKDSTYLKMYVDKNKKIIFDINPLIDGAVDKISKSSVLGEMLFGNITSDVKVSYDQIEYILDRKLDTIEDNGVSTDLIKDVSKGKYTNYTLVLLKQVDENDKLIGDDAYYFELDLTEDNTRLIIGIPTDNKISEVSAKIYTDEITWSFVGDYSYKNVDEIEMPESTVSDKTIDMIRSIYEKYLKLAERDTL
nr:hypothetical protein [uncultured Mediterraneibacter sp.]